MERNIVFLGLRTGTSKKGNHYCVANYGLFDNGSYIAVQSFINDEALENKLQPLEVLGKYKANVVFVNNQNLLVDIY